MLPSPLALAYPPLWEINILKPVVVTSQTDEGYLLENNDLLIVRGTALIRTGQLFSTRKRKRGLATSLQNNHPQAGGTKSMTGDEL